MVTKANVDMLSWYTQATSPLLDGNYPSGARPSGGSFDIPFGANRTSGVAPLAVQFDAGYNRSVAGQVNYFHEYAYLWSYGDAGSGTWGTNGRSKNSDNGPIGAHVFETPGVYTVTLNVFNPLTGALVRSESVEITVTDPDVVYAGTDTICVCNVGLSDFAGAPSGADTYESDDISSFLTTHAASNKRILLHRGSSWSFSTGAIGTAALTNFTLGAYGTGTNPDSQGLFDNAPLLIPTADTTFFVMSQKTDCRVMDLEYDSSLALGAFTSGAYSINNNLVMNVKAAGGRVTMGNSNWRSNDSETIDGNFYVNNNISGADVNNFFSGGDRLCLLGNDIQNAITSHSVRIWQNYRGIARHNISAGASYVSTTGRHALKMHAPIYSEIGTFAETGNLGRPNGTEFVNISDNIFGSSPPWPVAFGPQSAGSSYDERVSDLIFERNLYESDRGLRNATRYVGVPFTFWCSFTTVRNNIANLLTADADSGGTFVQVDRRATEPVPSYVWVYNNSVTTDHNVGTWVGVNLSSVSINCIARNNFLYAPNATENVVVNSGTDNTTSNNLDGLTTPMEDPFNATPSNRDYTLSVSSGAINTGIQVPVYEDYSGTLRTGTFDVGAYVD